MQMIAVFSSSLGQKLGYQEKAGFMVLYEV